MDTAAANVTRYIHLDRQQPCCKQTKSHSRLNRRTYCRHIDTTDPLRKSVTRSPRPGVPNLRQRSSPNSVKALLHPRFAAAHASVPLTVCTEGPCCCCVAPPCFADGRRIARKHTDESERAWTRNRGGNNIPRAVARGRAVIGAKAEADATQAAARTARYMVDAKNEFQGQSRLAFQG